MQGVTLTEILSFVFFCLFIYGSLNMKCDLTANPEDLILDLICVQKKYFSNTMIC